MPEEIAKHIIPQMTWLDPGRYRMIDIPPFLEKIPSQETSKLSPIQRPEEAMRKTEQNLSNPTPAQSPPMKNQTTIEDFFPPLRK
jgi:hypothetical protein